MRGPGHGDPAVTGPGSGRDREHAPAAEPAQRVMPGAAVPGQARLGHRAGDIAGQVVEVARHLYTEAPKCRKYRKTIYPRRTPDGSPHRSPL